MTSEIVCKKINKKDSNGRMETFLNNLVWALIAVAVAVPLLFK